MTGWDAYDPTQRFYLQDFTPFFASRTDPRISWCAYVPTTFEPGDKSHSVAVVIHGTERRAEGYRDRFAEFGEQHRCVVVAPLFPAGLTTHLGLDDYKWVRSGALHFDKVLIDLLGEIGAIYDIDVGKVLMHGFSGGGHFVHRFLILHPCRVLGASIGAPGAVTLVDESRPWWVGTSDVEARFSIGLDLETLRGVPVQTVIGDEDRATWEITLTPDDPFYMPEANRAGVDRRERIASLADSLERVGVDVRRDVVRHVAHDGFAVLDPVRDFFADVLRSTRSR